MARKKYTYKTEKPWKLKFRQTGEDVLWGLIKSEDDKRSDERIRKDAYLTAKAPGLRKPRWKDNRKDRKHPYFTSVGQRKIKNIIKGAGKDGKDKIIYVKYYEYRPNRSDKEPHKSVAMSKKAGYKVITDTSYQRL